MFGVDVSDLIFGIQNMLSNNERRATLWVLDTCLIVGLRLLIIIIITASLSSKTYNVAPRLRSVFLHIQLNGTTVWLPNMHKSPLDVDFESSRSLAKSES